VIASAGHLLRLQRPDDVDRRIAAFVGAVESLKSKRKRLIRRGAVDAWEEGIAASRGAIRMVAPFRR
jgi:hypothetical protein